MKILGIIGSGHLGQQIAHIALTDNHFSKVVFFDDFNDEGEVNGIKIIGKTNLIEDSFRNKIFHELIIAVGYKHMKMRKMIFDNYKGKVPFATIVHSSCLVDVTAKIGEGSIIYPGSIIDAHVKLMDNILVNIGCSISHDTIIHSHSFMAPRVALAGFVTVGEECILGINSTVIDNIKIESCVQLGGSTVVINNIEKPGLYVGNPGRLIKK